MKISVVIPAFNEEANIGKSLQALEAQTLPKKEFEIIVVDNGSTDSTVATANSFRMRLPLTVVTKVAGSIASVRNYGASLSLGEVIAFLDADCIPRPTWLEDGLAVAPTNSIWGAHYLVPSDATWVGKVWFEYQAKEQEGPVSFIPGSNLFITKKQFNVLGGFSEVTETSEDVEISLRARRHGMQTLAYPILAVSHEGTPRTLGHFYRQNRWHGKHVVRIFLANLPSTKNLHLLVMSGYIFVMFWAAILVPVVLLPRHHWLLALVPLLLLLLPAGVLSLWKTAAARRVQAAPPLFILYMTYFLSRAASLTHMPARNHR